MTDFYRILGKSGSDSVLFAHKASLLLDDNMLDDALNLCELGVKRYPFYAEGHYVLGRCYQLFERYDDAKNEFERALFFAPGHVKAFGALAYVFYKKKLKKMGNRCLLKNAVHEPNNTELLDYLEAQGLYAQLFTAPIVESQLAADLDGFLPSEAEKKDLQERVEKTFGTSDETKRILKKEQIDLTQESYKDQDNFEITSIMDSLDESDGTKTGIDLSQYANVDDDFSTLMGDFVTDQKSGKQNEVRIDDNQPAKEGESLSGGSDLQLAAAEPDTPQTDSSDTQDDAALSIAADTPDVVPPAEIAAVDDEMMISEEKSDQKQEAAFSDLLKGQQPESSGNSPAFESDDLNAVSIGDEQPDEAVFADEEPAVIKDSAAQESFPDSNKDDIAAIAAEDSGELIGAEETTAESVVQESVPESKEDDIPAFAADDSGELIGVEETATVEPVVSESFPIPEDAETPFDVPGDDELIGVDDVEVEKPVADVEVEHGEKEEIPIPDTIGEPESDALAMDAPAPQDELHVEQPPLETPAPEITPEPEKESTDSASVEKPPIETEPIPAAEEVEQKTKEVDSEPEGIDEQDLIFIKRKDIASKTEEESKDESESSVSLDDIMANPSLVTPTFGEILISQRKFDEARQVFLNLSERQPDNPRFKEKVEFLEKLIKLQG